MKRKLLIRDVTLRDGQQSLSATRMTQTQVDKALHLYKDANFYAMEVWGGAVPDSIMRYLGENPWERLEKIKNIISNSSKLTALSRGRNLFGYNPYPEEVIEGFCRLSVQSGIGIMRIFDALNDVDNIKSSIKYVKENGGIADATVCYTVDPYFSSKDKLKALLRAKKLPGNIFTDDYFLKKALELQALGADMITIKDMAGLIPPLRSGRIVRLLKEKLKIPLNFHTHCTPGYGLASSLMAIINGVDVLDTSIMNFAGGSAAPAYELIQLFCNKLGIETGVNQQKVVEINKILKEIRTELADFDNYKKLPREFDITKDALPRVIDDLFTMAIEYAQNNKGQDLLHCCHKIEEYFGFPEPDENIKNAEIPGGMYSNMLVQLKQLKLENLLPRVLEIIPTVRLAAGCPPLVTPTSQIVGVQAVNCVIDENKGQPFYTTKSIQFVNLVKGQYGKTPMPVKPEFRYKIAGVKKETPYDTRNYKKQDNPVFPDYGDVKLAENERDELLLELFPSVASEFLKNRIINKYLEEIHRIEEEKRQKFLKEKQAYESLSKEEKQKRLLEGLSKL
ncbi:MAG: carboxylase [Bacteroidales bacterium]|nr:carboxylase [Bacteroidales bacterium]